ncbi:P83/100 family protein [Borrelia puertoricensis]|uniref:P83/100 family protein n=1 Tax=Borrelia puertoricensis TaxID=2756107 RepID=UPI003EBBCD0C
MKRIWVLFIFLFIFFNVFTFHSREVDKKKLKDFINMDLEFVNYRGPYDSTDTYQQIVGIGEFLARNLINNKSNYYNKYYVDRYIDSEDEKSSSDVFIIGERSSLDSILNLRKILIGYLMEGFSYSKESAELLAKAITIYNATYRGDLEYYSDSYIQPALKDLSKHNVGLSRVYSQWAGKTHIFIPLKRNILSGNIESDVDLDKIVTEKVVISLLSENEEVGTDFARDLTDVQDEIRDIDQEKIDVESVTLRSIDDELTETIDNLREQLEKATDDVEKTGIKKQIDDKIVERNILKNKAEELKKSQKKLNSSQDRLDRQRDIVKDKIQESIDKENKDKNLPKPGDIISPKVDEKLQLTETIEDLKEQLDRVADDAEKEEIKRQIDDKIIERDAVKDKNLSKPGDIISPKVDEKLQLTETIEDLKKQLDRVTDDAEREEIKRQIDDKIIERDAVKDRNLPKPGEVSSSKKDEKIKSSEDLKKQFEKATDDVEKTGIKKQINDKIVGRNILKNKAEGLKKSQKKLDKQKDIVKKDRNFPKPREVSLSAKDKKLNSAEELKKQLKKATDDTSKSTSSVSNNLSSKPLSNKPLNSKDQLVQQEALDKLSLENENHKPVFLEVLNPNTNLGVLRLIDSDKDQLDKKISQYGIRRYGVYEREDDFVAIKLCSGIAKLQLLNKAKDLKVESEANFELSRDSSLFVDSKMILVVVKDNNVWKLAKFSSRDLSEFILSEDEVLPFTSFTVNAGHVYLQDASKKIIILDLNTLKKVS